MKTLYREGGRVLCFYIENNTKVAHREWQAADQANPTDTARLIARVCFVALAEEPEPEVAPTCMTQFEALAL